MAAAYGLPVEGLSGYRAAHPGANAGELLSAIQTDWYWRIPAVRLADAHASTARASTYTYEFARRSPQFKGRLGAAHSVEIPFVFDTLGLGSQPLLGPAPPAIARSRNARSLGCFCRQGRLRLVQIQSRPEANDALRRDVGNHRRSSRCEARPVEGRALVTPAAEARGQ